MALSEFDRRDLDRWSAEATAGDDSPVMMELPLKVVERLLTERRNNLSGWAATLRAKRDLETDLSAYRELERHRERAAKRITA